MTADCQTCPVTPVTPVTPVIPDHSRPDLRCRRPRHPVRPGSAVPLRRVHGGGGPMRSSPSGGLPAGRAPGPMREGGVMATVAVGLAVSVDGYIAGPNDGNPHPLGDG